MVVTMADTMTDANVSTMSTMNSNLFLVCPSSNHTNETERDTAAVRILKFNQYSHKSINKALALLWILIDCSIKVSNDERGMCFMYLR